MEVPKRIESNKKWNPKVKQNLQEWITVENNQKEPPKCLHLTETSAKLQKSNVTKKD